MGDSRFEPVVGNSAISLQFNKFTPGIYKILFKTSKNDFSK